MTDSADCEAGTCQRTVGTQSANGASPSEPSTRLFFEGDELYAAMLRSIAGARISVWMECYLFASDEIGWMFARALAERAEAGVDVRVHLDAAGGLGRTSDAMVAFLREHRAQVQWFHRWSWRDPWRYNRRNHRKLLVVDDALAYVGGFNIHRESAQTIVGETRWRDTHAAIDGPLAAQAAALFEMSWQGRCDRSHAPCRVDLPALLPNHNRSCRQRIRCLYAEWVAAARQHIRVTTPYFVPDLRLLRRLAASARRGVEVVLLVPRHSDVTLAQWAARAFYGRLIKAGVHVYEYLPRMLHAKTMVVDGRRAVVGTANLDYRSLHLNYELLFATEQADVCAQLDRQFEDDVAQSERITRRRWAARSGFQRLLERIGYTMRRWL